QRKSARVPDHLPGTIARFHDLQAQRLGFIDERSQGLFEQNDIDGSVDLETLADVVCGTGRVDLLGKPDTQLCSRQRKLADVLASLRRALERVGNIRTEMRHRPDNPFDSRAMNLTGRACSGNRAVFLEAASKSWRPRLTLSSVEHL